MSGRLHHVRLTVALMVLAAGAAGPGFARAQTPIDYRLDPNLEIVQYVHDKWTTEEGLPHNVVEAVLPGREGYLWLGSAIGLVRFDGARFTVFNSRNEPAFQGDRVQSLLQTRDGALWAGLSVGGLVRLKDGTFTRFDGGQAFPLREVRALAEHSSGLWIGSREGAFRLSDGVIQPVEPDRIRGAVIDFEFAADGDVWIATYGNGLYRLGADDVVHYSESDILPTDWINDIALEPDGSLLLALFANGVARLRGGVLTPVREDVIGPRTATRLLLDRDGALWTNLVDVGLVRIFEGRVSRFGPEDGLPETRVRAFATDPEGSLWVGTYGGGLNRFRSGAVTTFNTKQGLPDDEVRGLFEDADGTLWVAGHGLARSADGRFEAVGFEEFGSHADLATVIQTSDGTHWVGRTSGGLWSVREGKATKHGVEDGLASDFVTALLETPDGVVWVGTSLALSALRDGGWTNLDVRAAGPGNVFVLHGDPDGTVWTGGPRGLFRVEADTLAPVKRDVVVRAIYRDRRGSLWYGSLGQGLYRLDGDGRVDEFRMTDGLYDNDIWSIVEDDYGTLWMCSDRGIFNAPIAGLEAFAAGTVDRIVSTGFGQADGMKDVECNSGTSPSAIKTRSGTIWFPTQGGAVRVDPSSPRRNGIPPQVHIERVVRNGVVVDSIDGARLGPGRRDFEFHFTATSLLFPERVEFRHRLVGYDEGWVSGKDRSVRYTNLEPGNYEFRVQASNNDGVWNPEGASIAFRLDPYFHESGWLYLGLFAAVIAAGFALDRYRRIRQQALEVLVSERTAELEFANRGMSRFLARMSHELRTPLNAIIGFSELLGDQTGDGLTSKQARYVSNVRNSGRHLLQLINDVLDMSKVEADKMELALERVRVCDLLAEVRPIADELARKKGVTFAIEDEVGSAEAVVDGLRIKQVLLNLIGNAVKFTPSGRLVTLKSGRFQRENGQPRARDWIRVSVEDEGTGVASEDLERIFDPFEQVGGSDHQGTGLGLPLSRKLVELHGGRLWAESAGPGHGSTFTFEVPVQGRAADSPVSERANRADVQVAIDERSSAGSPER